jgi:hypothetical protein
MKFSKLGAQKFSRKFEKYFMNIKKVVKKSSVKPTMFDSSLYGFPMIAVSQKEQILKFFITLSVACNYLLSYVYLFQMLQVPGSSNSQY